MNEIKNIIRRLRETKVLENYSFMTALSVLSALIGLIIYPYVIRVVGKEMYGTYVYALTLISYFLIVMDFGFDPPCAKAIVQANGNKDAYSHIVSAVFTAKLLLTIICGGIIAFLFHFVPFMASHKMLCVFAFVQAFAQVLFPGWYFQGTKTMKVVTYINLGIRVPVERPDLLANAMQKVMNDYDVYSPTEAHNHIISIANKKVVSKQLIEIYQEVLQNSRS